jgi:type IV fimbrial biogenesis protein FimT
MLVNRVRKQFHSSGFTLVELMTVISILVVVALLAAPSFRIMLANQRVRNASYDLMSAITLTRSQAIADKSPVTLSSADDGWSAGWTVANGATTYETRQPLSGLAISNTAELDAVTYGRDGRSITSATKFTIQPDPAIEGVSPRCLSISLNGMPSITLGACT